MKCQECDAPATVHVTKIAKGTGGRREVHLCERCARKHHLIPDQPAAQIDLKALLGLLLGQPGGAAGGNDPAALKCPACGLKYAQFRADGRLGCPAEYDAFRPALEPLLDRIHRARAHAGKAPRAAAGRAEAARLRDLLAAAVAAERYEEAAALRDRLRQKEAPG